MASSGTISNAGETPALPGERMRARRLIRGTSADLNQERTASVAASPEPLSKQKAEETSSSHWTQRQPGKEDEVGLVAAPLRSVTLRIMLLGTLLIFINC